MEIMQHNLTIELLGHSSFTVKDNIPDWKVQTSEWNVEDTRKWRTEDTDNVLLRN